MSGILFVIGTPIGNLGDLSDRSRSCLSDCDVIFAEDTRRTCKLTNYLGIKKHLVSYHGFNEKQRIKVFDEYAVQGANIALVSDAGTPLISDPGSYLVERAIELGVTVVPVPGPSALILALIGSGLPCRRFAFEGFLPDNRNQRRAHLKKLASEERSLVFYVAPHDVRALVPEMLEAFGPRRACLARELTKKYEQFIRANLASMVDKLALVQIPLKGEFVLVVEGSKPMATTYSQEDVIDQLRTLVDNGLKLTDAAAQVAKISGWPRPKVYKLGLPIVERRREEEPQA